MDRLDYEAIAEAEADPTRLAILRLMLREPAGDDPGWSAKTVSDGLELSLSRASHHFRVLAAAELIEHVGDRPRRGALQRFYVVACRAA
jgi:DNA-binding transcriptional ArsR family regulator